MDNLGTAQATIKVVSDDNPENEPELEPELTTSKRKYFFQYYIILCTISYIHFFNENIVSHPGTVTINANAVEITSENEAEDPEPATPRRRYNKRGGGEKKHFQIIFSYTSLLTIIQNFLQII